MSAFMSVCRTQISLVAKAPQMQIIMMGVVDVLVGYEKISLKRTSPYPPSFRRIAAKIIDPAMGASTCAFGSHRWVPYIGSFARKATIEAMHQSVRELIENWAKSDERIVSGILAEDVEV